MMRIFDRFAGLAVSFGLSKQGKPRTIQPGPTNLATGAGVMCLDSIAGFVRRGTGHCVKKWQSGL